VRHFATTLAALGLAVLLLAPAVAQTPSERGERLYATLQTPLSTKTAHPGDRFTMSVNEPFPNGSDLTGATISGHVSQVVRAGQGVKPQLQLAFDSVEYPDGTSAPINAALSSLQTKSQPKNPLSVAAKTLGGLIAGNIIGRGIFGLGGGFAGAVGAVGGLLYGLNDKSDVEVAQGAQATLTLGQPLHARRQAPL
jgi:hypothetical protein